MNLIQENMKSVLARWVDYLAIPLERSQDEILSDGLRAGDFGALCVRIQFEDGSMVQFRRVLVVQNVERPGVVAIFTEHNGYHEFPLTEEDVIVFEPI